MFFGSSQRGREDRRPVRRASAPAGSASYRPRGWARRHLTPRRRLARPLGHRQPPTTGGSNSRARRYSLSRSEASNRSLSVTPSIALSAITTIRGVMLRPRSETSNTPAARPRRVARRAVAPAAARPNGRMRGTAPSPVKATPSGPRQAAPRARRDSSRRENHHHRAQHLETRRRGKAGGRAGARRRTARRGEAAPTRCSRPRCRNPTSACCWSSTTAAVAGCATPARDCAGRKRRLRG